MNILCFIAFLLPIIGPSASIVLPCLFEFENDEFYSCVVQSPFTITSSSASARTITSVTGTHEAGQTNGDVIVLKASSLTINYIPLGIDVFFPNLTTVLFSICQLQQIQPSDLAQFPKAIKFFFSRNQITEIPAGLFSAQPETEIIVFNYNNISCIGSGVFNGLPLTVLDLRFNGCTGFGAFDDAPAIASGLPTVYSNCSCASPTTTVSPCVQAEQNQTIQFNNTIASLRNELTATINAAVSGLCTAGSCSSLSTSIANLDNKLTAFIAQTNNNFQNAFAALNNITLSINAIDTRLRRFERSTCTKLDDLQRCCYRRSPRITSRY